MINSINQGNEDFIKYLNNDIFIDKSLLIDELNDVLGHVELYNPYSVINALTTKEYKNYFKLYSELEHERNFFQYNKDNIYDEILKLINDEDIHVFRIFYNDDIHEIESKDALLVTLIHYGYLGQYDCDCYKIPNLEMKYEILKEIKLSNIKQL